MAKEFKPLLDSLPKSASIAQIIKRAERLAHLNQKLQLKLPPQVKGLLILANLRDDAAVLLCNTQMEASKVRMYSRAILQILQNEFKVSINKIFVKVKKMDN